MIYSFLKLVGGTTNLDIPIVNDTAKLDKTLGKNSAIFRLPTDASNQYSISPKALQHKQSGLPPFSKNTPKPRPRHGGNLIPDHPIFQAIDRRDYPKGYDIIEGVFPYTNPIDTLNRFNPRFSCPRCGRSAEIVERNRRYLKLRCPKCGCFLKWVGGRNDA
ncbi:hypothetical protein [Chroococcus sp. FPU101]|uniref:hypothetical protein n=1 Tax=Chroococcus sp. FPU101 TaxID=1974212 RepID=UPI001A8ECD3C|nr:hypothetical protein [Chroococcus sp. FPU101]